MKIINTIMSHIDLFQDIVVCNGIETHEALAQNGYIDKGGCFVSEIIEWSADEYISYNNNDMGETGTILNIEALILNANKDKHEQSNYIGEVKQILEC